MKQIYDIQQQNSFFNYGSEHNKSHETKPIHPALFRQLFTQQQSQNQQTIIQDIIKKHVDLILKPIKRMLKNTFKERCIDNENSIYNLMKNGDYLILDSIMKYEKQKEVSFQELVFQKMKIQICNQLQKFASKIQNILYMPDCEVQQSQKMEQIVKKEANVDFRGSQNQIDIRLNLKRLYNLGEDSNKDESDQLLKRYLIKQIGQIKQQNDLVSQQLQEISKQQILIFNCKVRSKTLAYIKRNYPQLKAIHIFSPNFAERDIIMKILKFYQDLQIFSLNCDHNLQWNDVKQLEQDYMHRFKKFELKWNIEDFFEKYGILINFPNENINKVQRSKKVNNIKNFELFRNNSTLLIEDNKYMLQLKNLQWKNIRTLHFTNTSQQHLMQIKNIRHLQNIPNLTTLHLAGISFVGGQRHFKEFITKNVQIQIIVMNRCVYAPDTVNQCLQHLRLLPRLKSLFLSSDTTDSLLIQPKIIFSFLNLQHLYLYEVRLNTMNSQGLSGINNLTLLKHLNLCGIPQISSDIFKYLAPRVFKNLEFLNITYSSVDSKIADYLPQFKNLLYLSCDEVNIKGIDYLRAFKRYFEIEGKYMKLKGLSCEQPSDERYKRLNGSKQREWNFNIVIMKEVAKLLPSLEYLCISNCQALRGYDFKEFSSLRIININKKQSKYLKNLSKTIKIIIYGQ